MRTAAQRRYAEKNKEALRAKDARKNHHNKDSDALNRNQRNSDLGWLWMKWSNGYHKRLIFDYGKLRILSAGRMVNPRFTFSYRGVRRRESLLEPLPQWESRGNDA